MAVISFEGIIENGQVRLNDAVRLPDKAKVYLLIPEYEGESPLPSDLQQRAMRIFAEADAQGQESAPSLADPQEAAWAQGVAEKAQRMGLKTPPSPSGIRRASPRLANREDAVRLTKVMVKEF